MLYLQANYFCMGKPTATNGTSDSSSNGSNGNMNIGVIVGGTLGGMTMIIIIMLCIKAAPFCYFCNRRRRKHNLRRKQCLLVYYMNAVIWYIP